MIEQGDHHGGNHLQARDALALDQLQHGRRVELPNHHMPPAGQREDVRRAPTVDVEQRHRVEVRPRVGRRHAQGGVKGMQIEIAVRQHDPFGISRRAAGVKEFGHGVFIDLAVINVARVGRRPAIRRRTLACAQAGLAVIAQERCSAQRIALVAAGLPPAE